MDTDKHRYPARLKTAVEQLYNCAAVHRETVPVHEVVKGRTLWKGDVEVYDLTGHPKAKRAYAWSHCEHSIGEDERFVAVLEIPPVNSAVSAVHFQIVKDYKEAQKELKEIMNRKPEAPPPSN